MSRYSDDKNALLVLAQLKQKDPPPLKTSPDEVSPPLREKIKKTHN